MKNDILDSLVEQGAIENYGLIVHHNDEIEAFNNSHEVKLVLSNGDILSIRSQAPGSLCNTTLEINLG